jgi:hypothetical protein
MIGICRDHAKNVKHWRDGQMAMRWSAAGMLEASKQFRRVKRGPSLATARKSVETSQKTGDVTISSPGVRPCVQARVDDELRDRSEDCGRAEAVWVTGRRAQTREASKR